MNAARSFVDSLAAQQLLGRTTAVTAELYGSLALTGQPKEVAEEVARQVDQIEAAIRQEIPKDQLKGIIDNIGLPYSGINLTYSNSGVASAADADILVSLGEKHDPTAKYVSQIRKRVHRDFPGITSSFPPADIVAQILNNRSPKPGSLTYKRICQRCCAA